MCYTSGTTGDPKGVLYSHRSNVLHAMIAVQPDAMGISSQGFDPAGGADVPRQRMGPRPQRANDRSQAGHAGRAHGRPGDLRTARHREGDDDGGRADGLADAAAISGGDRQQAPQSEEGHHRRLGLPARHDAEVPGQLRGGGDSRLGHDRNVAAGLALLDEARVRRPERRREAGPPAESRALRLSASR